MVGALVKHEQNLVDISKDARDNEGRTRQCGLTVRSGPRNCNPGYCSSLDMVPDLQGTDQRSSRWPTCPGQRSLGM